MKAFFLKLGLFAMTSFALVNGIAAIYAALEPAKVNAPGAETYESIRRAEAPGAHHLIVTGDSVCHQLLLVQTPPDCLNLSCNWAVTVAGQYMLAHEALKHCTGVQEIILAYQPTDFQDGLTRINTYHYFVKPFYPRAEFRELMSPGIMGELDKRPLFRLSLLPMFRYTGMLDSVNYTDHSSVDYQYICPRAAEYLRRFAEMCQAKGIRLKVISTPISTASGYDEKVFLQEVAAAKLGDIFAGYTATIRYVPPEVLVDGIHFKKADIKPNSDEFLKLLN